jgi:hypothetical protein
MTISTDAPRPIRPRRLARSPSCFQVATRITAVINTASAMRAAIIGEGMTTGVPFAAAAAIGATLAIIAVTGDLRLTELLIDPGGVTLRIYGHD